MSPEPPNEAIARRLVAEDALVTSNLVSGLLLAALALAAPERHPRLLVQRGHMVRLGGVPLAEVLDLAGASTADVGSVDSCNIADLEPALTRCDLALYVVHPSAAGAAVDLPRFVWSAHAAGRPALVLDPVSGNWTAWLDAGADLVVLDAAALSGATGGIVAGESSWIGKCRQLLLGTASPFAADEAQVAQVAASMSNWKPPQEPRIEAAAFHATVAS